MSDAVERLEEWCESIEQSDMAVIWPADVRAVLSALTAARQEKAEAVREAYELVEQMIIKERDAHPGYWPVCEGLRLEVIALKEAQ